MLDSWLCPNDLHVFTWTGSSTNPADRPSGYCGCGAVWYDASEKRITLMFPGYNPYGPHAPRPAPTEAADVPLHIFHAAQRVGGTCLSADGKYVYTMRYGRVLQAEWKGSDFGAWLDIGEEMPAGAVRM